MNVKDIHIQEAVLNSSSLPIQDAARRLHKSSFPRKCWLDKTNPYGKDTINILKNEGKNAPTMPDQLAEYIAASVVLHSADGWTFFSHAIDQLINGDEANSIFMAYYAQLRAVMSFLASEGIGIFKNDHFWFDHQGNCKSFSKNTHDAVKMALNEWAETPLKSNRLLNLLNLQGKSFAEWVEAAELKLNGPGVIFFAKDCLKSWSVDLDILGQDHTIRNETSYRPQGIYPYHRDDGLKNYLFLLANLWHSSEPVGANRFDLLDRHLLRNTLQLTLRYRYNTGNAPDNVAYYNFVKDAMVNLGLSPKGNLFDFLSSSDTTQNPLILEEALKIAKNQDGSIRALPVISRAYLLLRLASAATQEFLLKSSIEKKDLSFWWESFGNDVGLWIPGNVPEQMEDLWADVKDSVETIEDWNTQNSAPGMGSVLKVKMEHPFDTWQIKQFHRVGLWGIGL